MHQPTCAGSSGAMLPLSVHFACFKKTFFALGILERAKTPFTVLKTAKNKKKKRLSRVRTVLKAFKTHGYPTVN